MHLAIEVPLSLKEAEQWIQAQENPPKAESPAEPKAEMEFERVVLVELAEADRDDDSLFVVAIPVEAAEQIAEKFNARILALHPNGGGTYPIVRSLEDMEKVVRKVKAVMAWAEAAAESMTQSMVEECPLKWQREHGQHGLPANWLGQEVNGCRGRGSLIIAGLFANNGRTSVMLKNSDNTLFEALDVPEFLDIANSEANKHLRGL